MGHGHVLFRSLGRIATVRKYRILVRSHYYYSITKSSFSGSYRDLTEFSKGGAVAPAPVGSPRCAPLVPPAMCSDGSPNYRIFEIPVFRFLDFSFVFRISEFPN